MTTQPLYGGPASDYGLAYRQAWLLDHSQAYWGRTLNTTPDAAGVIELLTWDAFLVIHDWADTVGNFASKPVGWNT